MNNEPLRALCLAVGAACACGAIAYWNMPGPNAPAFAVLAFGFMILAMLPYGDYVSRSDNSRTEVTNNIYTAAPAPQPQYQPQPAAYYPPPQMQQPQIIMMPAAQPGMTPEMVAQIVRGMTQAQAQTPLLPQGITGDSRNQAPESRYTGNVIDVTPERAPPMLMLPTDRRHLTAQTEAASFPLRLINRMKSNG